MSITASQIQSVTGPTGATGAGITGPTGETGATGGSNFLVVGLVGPTSYNVVGNEDVILCDTGATGGTATEVTVNLLGATLTAAQQKEVNIKNIGQQNVTIHPATGDSIDGATGDVIISTLNVSLELVSNRSNGTTVGATGWEII